MVFLLFFFFLQKDSRRATSAESSGRMINHSQSKFCVRSLRSKSPVNWLNFSNARNFLILVFLFFEWKKEELLDVWEASVGSFRTILTSSMFHESFFLV